MAHLIDSSALLDDADKLRQRLREDGYLFLRGLVDATAVLDVRRQILTELADRGWLAPGSEPDAALPAENIRTEAIRTEEELAEALQPEGWFAGYTAIQRLEDFHRLAFSEPLLYLCRQVLGADAFPHPRKIARVVYPKQSRLTTAPHQDYTHIQGTADFVTTWLPLGNYNEGAGGLRILPGSANEGVRALALADGAGGAGCVLPPETDGWLTTDFAPGDALLFHSLTLHAGTPNNADRLRLSVDYRYQSAGDPITPESLRPHYPGYVPPWDDLSAGWSSSAWIEPPQGITVHDFVPPGGAEGLSDWHLRVPPPISRLIELS